MNSASREAMSICVITPARNEVEHLDGLFRAISGQTVRPQLWILVDDASCDGTREKAIAMSEHDWVRTMSFKPTQGKIFDRSFKAFEYGLEHIPRPFELIMKLDADTWIPPNYLQLMISKFQLDRRLGIASGINQGEWTMAHHLRGNNRVYRWRCWRGLRIPADGIGWDTVDVLEAKALGWKTTPFGELMCRHMRSRKGDPQYGIHLGKVSRHLGYYLWYVLGRFGLFVKTDGPVQAMAFLVGYVAGGLGASSPETRILIRTDQITRLHNMMRAALRSEDRRQVAE